MELFISLFRIIWHISDLNMNIYILIYFVTYSKIDEAEMKVEGSKMKQTRICGDYRAKAITSLFLL